MSRNRRRFSPHGRKFNERGVERTHKVFDKGLVTDSIEVPDGALGELDNARAFGSEVRGAHGSLLHNRADYQLSPDNNETYAEALLQGGSIYEAKGSAPQTGDLFLTLSPSDFSDSKLREAKRLYYNCRDTDKFRDNFLDYRYTENIPPISGEIKIGGITRISYFDANGVDVSPTLSSFLIPNTWIAISNSTDENSYTELFIDSVNDNVGLQVFEVDIDSNKTQSGGTTPTLEGDDIKLHFLGEGRYFNDNFPSPQLYEFYGIDLSLDKPVYRGFLQIPYHNGFHSKVVNGELLKFSVIKTGNTVTINTGTPTIFETFSDELIGMYISYGIVDIDGVSLVRRDLIVEAVDLSTLKVSSDSIVPDGTYDNCLIQPQIHSSVYMPSVNKMYFHIGYEFYEVSVPIINWKLLYGLYERKPFDSPSIMNEVKGDVLVTNDNGHFRIKVNKGDEPTHYWKINSVRPDKPANTIKYFFGFETSASSTGENPYAPRGFSGETATGESDKTGGALL